METESLGQPCRNFQILGIGSFIDPVDGLEKVVLSNFAAGATGNLILIDPASGEGEDIPLPGDSGAWAVLNWRDEKLLIGTCGTYGYLHCLDLASRTWAEPLRDPDEAYIWNLCIGSDGLVYGGTYPGCVLLRYDPHRHELQNMGRMSDESDNLYSRMVYGGVPGHILVSCGTANPHQTLWNIESGQTQSLGPTGAAVRGVGDGFISLQSGDQAVCYDSATFERLEQDRSDQLTNPPAPPSRYGGMWVHTPLASGSWLVNRGQEYYVDDGGHEAPELCPIPAQRPATQILTITADEAGNIWGAAGFGQTIFRHEPDTRTSWNSQVVTDNSGEVYGMAFAHGRLYLATYSGGDHVVYDPASEWGQLDNSNPVTLESVSPRLIRPSGKSVVGPDGHVWSGWMAAYGVYGGGLSKIDVDTHEMSCWYDPVPEQAVMSVAADATSLYFITGGQANGLAPKTVEPHFVVWDCTGRITWQHEFDIGTSLTSVAATGGDYVAIAIGDAVQFYRPASQRLDRPIPVGAPIRYVASLPDGCIAAFSEDHVWRIVPTTGQVEDVGDTPGRVNSMAVTAAGVIYLAVGTELVRWAI